MDDSLVCKIFQFISQKDASSLDAALSKNPTLVDSYFEIKFKGIVSLGSFTPILWAYYICHYESIEIIFKYSPDTTKPIMKGKHQGKTLLQIANEHNSSGSRTLLSMYNQYLDSKLDRQPQSPKISRTELDVVLRQMRLEQLVSEIKGEVNTNGHLISTPTSLQSDRTIRSTPEKLTTRSLSPPPPIETERDIPRGLQDSTPSNIIPPPLNINLPSTPERNLKTAQSASVMAAAAAAAAAAATARVTMTMADFETPKKSIPADKVRRTRSRSLDPNHPLSSNRSRRGHVARPLPKTPPVLHNPKVAGFTYADPSQLLFRSLSQRESGSTLSSSVPHASQTINSNGKEALKVSATINATKAHHRLLDSSSSHEESLSLELPSILKDVETPRSKGDSVVGRNFDSEPNLRLSRIEIPPNEKLEFPVPTVQTREASEPTSATKRTPLFKSAKGSQSVESPTISFLKKTTSRKSEVDEELIHSDDNRRAKNRTESEKSLENSGGMKNSELDDKKTPRRRKTIAENLNINVHDIPEKLSSSGRSKSPKSKIFKIKKKKELSQGGRTEVKTKKATMKRERSKSSSNSPNTAIESTTKKTPKKK
jgi:hypothetical protein